MTPPTVVKLSEAHLHLQLHGPSAFLPTQFGSVEQRGGNVILWDPGLQHLAAQTQEAAHRTRRRAAESALIRRDRFT